MRRFHLAAAVGAIVGTLTVPALAQDIEPNGAGREALPAWAKRFAADPDSPAMKTYAELQKRRLGLEKELKKLRYEHFRSTGKPAVREAGLVKLRAYTDPSIYPTLIDLFLEEGADVRGCVLDMFADQGTDEGDTSLAWVSVFGKSAATRGSARERFDSRVRAAGKTPPGFPLVVYQGLYHGSEEEVAGAADMAAGNGLLAAIPWLIDAQAPGQIATGGGGGQGTGALAYIFVGKQTAYISRLNPVVSESAVAFDPQLDVVSDGSLLVIGDAAVSIERGPVHHSLVDLSSGAWGQSTEKLGYNRAAWLRWWKQDFKPYWTRVLAERARAEREKNAREGARLAPPLRPMPDGPK